MNININNIYFKNNQFQSPSGNMYADFKKRREYYLAQPTNDEFVKNKTNKNKTFAIAGASLGIATLGAAAILGFKSDKFKAFLEMRKQIKFFKTQMKPFQGDINYRKAILNDMGLKPKDYHKLRPIIGAEELTSLVKELDNNPQRYAPGTKSYDGVKVYFPLKENVKNCTYGANLHLHTRYSDGQMTVPEVLEQSVKYADEVAAKNPSKSPFIIAITDHDAVKGCSDAIDIIRQDPWKYRNLRVVLGVENTTIHKNDSLLKSPVSVHLLSYGINPFGKDSQDFIISRVEDNHKNIKNVIQNANKKFQNILAKNNFTYNFEDAVKVAPCFEASCKDSSQYYMKDFMQFRLIYAHAVENNKPLTDFIKQQGIEPKDIDFVKPRELIPPAPDFSKGQKYWQYYYEALKGHITNTVKNKNPQVDENQLASKFINISDEVKNALGEIESGCLNPQSDLYIKNIQHNDFAKAVEKIASFEHGVMGIAHPGVVFPKNAFKDKNSIPKLYEELYGIFKEKGKDKARFVEDHYQVHWKGDDVNIRKELENISAKQGLLRTGGLDTHGKCIFEEGKSF